MVDWFSVGWLMLVG